MTQSHTASALSLVLAAAVVAATWLTTLGTPANAAAHTASAPAHVILA